jgi:hypothetical protein
MLVNVFEPEIVTDPTKYPDPVTIKLPLTIEPLVKLPLIT